MLTRPVNDALKLSLEIASDKKLTLDVRVASMFTYAQAAGAKGVPNLITLAQGPSVREFVLKALADRKAYANSVPLDLFIKSMNDLSPRVRLAAKFRIKIWYKNNGNTVINDNQLNAPESADATTKKNGREAASENINDSSNFISNAYLNPTSDKVTIDFNLIEKGDWKVSVFDATGKVIQTKNMELSKGMNIITLNKLIQGANFINFENGKNSILRKVIKN